MITALSVEFPEKGKGLKRLINSLKKDKAAFFVKRARGVYIKQVVYTSYSGKIKLEKIDKIIGAQRNHLLCEENIKLPENAGYRRFCSNSFAARLCTNMALNVIKNCECPEKLRVGVYDFDASSCDFLKLLLKYCANVTVVTANALPYRETLDEIMDEIGASAVLTGRVGELADCDFVIAPCEIREQLPVKREALVLASSASKETVSGLVYYKYYLRMPNGFDRIKPKELDEEYFCSALYTLGAQYELGTIVPSVCRNFSSSQTLKSLCAYVNRFA